MQSVRRILLSSASISLAVLVGAACEDEVEAPCKVDTDCPQGTICREERCVALSVDGGTSAAESGAAESCSSDGLSCLTPEECCSRACTSGRCGVAPAPELCKGLYELCQDDCCPGLSCTSGSCR